MNQFLLPFILIYIMLFGGCSESINPEFKVINLKCEYLKDALIAKSKPRFSWEIESSQEAQLQTAWQMMVSDDLEKLDAGNGNIWDSGKTLGNKTFGITWKDDRLRSFTKYYWKVRVWDRNGQVSDWGKPASFITGAFDTNDWNASWIGTQAEAPLEYPLLYKHIGYLSAYAAQSNDEKWVQIDLGKKKDFDMIRLYPSYNNQRSIKDYYFPLAYRIECSDDGKSWTELLVFPDGPAPLGEPIEHIMDESQARYIRFTATKMKQYDHINFNPDDRYNLTKKFAFSLAEVEVVHLGEVISLNRSVSYKDALTKIDRENGYDPDMLTDGITGTPLPPQKRVIPPSPLLRKTINLKERPVQALAYVSALGVYEIALNAQYPDQRVLAPEWTDYNKRVQYQVFDVSHMLKSGPNVISAQLADGWYAGMLGPVRWSPYFPKRGAYGLDRRLFFQMEIAYPDGKKETIVSDDSWKIFSDGPIRLADNFLGETYDANKEVQGWEKADFDDSAWENVFVDEELDVNLVPQINQPIKVVETLPAKRVSKTKAGHYIIDIGENIAGWCAIQLKGNPGDLIIMQHGEILDEEGELYTENLGMAVQIDSVILGPGGRLTYEPRFTYHGFRFVEVRGLRSQPDKSILEAKVITSDQPRTGYFACSNPMLNQLYQNINRSHVSNMHGIPTDCPQRDERCGWMGDAYIFAQTSIYNRNMAAFYNKWIMDIMDAQSTRGTFPDIAPHPFAYEKHFTGVPGWADAGIQVPYILYQNYGDQEIIEDHFQSYEKYIENILNNNPDFIWKNGLGNNYGDWLNGNTLRAEGFPSTGAQVPSEVFATIMFYNSTCNLSKMASIIGQSEKVRYYADLAYNIKKAFARAFVDVDGKIEGDAQSCYALALHYDIFPEDMEATFEKRMMDKFIPYDGRMNTGFHSTLPLMKELVKRGYEEKAFQLLETKEFPSWGYSIEQGATSIWERWDGYVKGRGMQGAGMNSFNHYAFGAIGEWMYKHIVGIQPDLNHPGFTHFILKPLPGGTLTWAEGSYHSICGKIEAKWTKKGHGFEYEITIPANTSATVHLPGKSPETVLINGGKLSDYVKGSKIEHQNGYIIFEVFSGDYFFSSTL
jgi:alpha-L-rhamnosidase